MVDNVSFFPLLQLPNDPLKYVLQNMELFHQLSFSILSERSKELVKSLNLEVQHITVSIGGIVHISVWPRDSFPIGCHCYTEEFYRIVTATGYQPLLTEIYTPDFLQAVNFENDELRSYQWNKQGFEIKDWINHFLSISNRPKLDKLELSAEVPFNLESLQKTVSDVTEIIIQNSYSDAYNQQVVQAYSFAKQLTLRLETLENLKEYHNIFCQGFDILSLEATDLSSCKLDDLLIMNSRSIKINSEINKKDFKTFLNHWINGSNSRMEHMVLYLEVDADKVEEIILRGLNSQIVPTENKRTFRRFLNGSLETRAVIVKGGFDIHRMDGKTASIIYYEEEEKIDDSFNIEVFVWQ